MKFRDILLLMVCGLFFYSCKKPETGFLSDRLFYRNNPFGASLGRVTTHFLAPVNKTEEVTNRAPIHA